MTSLRQAGRIAIGVATIMTAIAGASGAASASIVAPTDLGLISGTSHWGATATSNSTTHYDYKFTLASQTASGAINLTATPLRQAQGFSAVTINLYSGTLATGTPLTSTSSLTVYPSKALTELLTIPALSAGQYLVDIVGTGKAGASFGATISVNPVPLPAALPLFGAALMGLGGLGWRRARRGTAAA
jgi:hypothetical protein